ncbi:MAG: hypothetical protein AAGI68_10750 [Planctomycetota bacterium]
MPIVAVSHHSLPAGSRFSELPSGECLTEEHSLGRQRLINRVRSDLSNGVYDDPETLARRLDTCLDRILADVSAGQ